MVSMTKYIQFVGYIQGNQIADNAPASPSSPNGLLCWRRYVRFLLLISSHRIQNMISYELIA